jgi:hypothetical protein
MSETSESEAFAPNALAIDEIARINAQHVETIRQMMSNILDGRRFDDDGTKKRKAKMASLFPPSPASAPVDPETNWHEQRHRHRFGFSLEQSTRLVETLVVPEGESEKFVAIEDICASADAQRNALLHPPVWAHVNSNRARVFARWLRECAGELMEQVPIRCADFDLLLEQRLAIACMANALPATTSTEIEITREWMQEKTAKGARKMGFKAKFSLEPDALPTFTIADFCTGAGKTVMASMAALVILVSKWQALRADYKHILRTRVREPHSGLCRGETIVDAKLARLAIVFAPAGVVPHWHRTLRSAAFGMRELHGAEADVVVWRGLAPNHSVQSAYDSGKPTLWVLPLGSASKAVMRATPHIGVAICIYDEMNSKHRSKFEVGESTVCFNYLTHATMASLSEATEGDPRHPLRLALGGTFTPVAAVDGFLRTARYSEVDRTLGQYCKILQFAVPSFLRELVSSAVTNNMPRGLHVHKVVLRRERLSQIVTGNGLITLNLADLVDTLLARQSSGGHTASLETRERFRAIFASRCSFESVEMINRIDAEIADVVPTSLQEANTRKAMIRLRDRLSDVFGDALPECPVSLETIEKKDVRILACCTGVISAGALGRCSSCPLCRAPLGKVGLVVEEEPPAKKQRTAPRNFSEGVQAISDGHTGALEGVVQVVSLQIAETPAARVLVCFGYGSAGGASAVRRLEEQVKAAHPTAKVYDINALSRDIDAAECAQVEFADDVAHPWPVVFVLNTSNTTSSVQGLDLWRTDLTVLADNCTQALQKQAIGRSLRMRPRPADMPREARFEAKRLVVAHLV